MRFFLDNCVPDAVATVLKKAGHEVILQREAIKPDASDKLVSLTSALNDAILISLDGDHKGLASRFAVSDRRLKKLSRIHLRCAESKAAERMTLALGFIESEWEIAQASGDARIFLEIQGNAFKTQR